MQVSRVWLLVEPDWPAYDLRLLLARLPDIQWDAGSAHAQNVLCTQCAEHQRAFTYAEQCVATR